MDKAPLRLIGGTLADIQGSGKAGVKGGGKVDHVGGSAGQLARTFSLDSDSRYVENWP